MSLWTPKEKQIVVPELIKGRSMVGYSRRGFLGMIAAAVGAAAAPVPQGWIGIDLACGSGPKPRFLFELELANAMVASYMHQRYFRQEVAEHYRLYGKG